MRLLLVSICIFVVTFVPPVLCQDNCSKPPKVPPGLECCEPPNWTETNDIKKCAEAESVFCYADCIFNVSGIVRNGAISTANVKKLLEDELRNDVDYIPIATKAFLTCYPMVKQRLGDKQPLVDGCNPLAGAAIECTNTQMFVDCPANKWTTSAQCEELKSFLKRCPLPNLTDGI